jgi:phospholipase A1
MSRWLSAGGAWVLIGTSLPLAAASLDTELARCAQVDEDVARLACFDRLSGKQAPVPDTRVDEPTGREPAFATQADVFGDDTLAERGSPVSPDSSEGRGRWLGIRPYRRNYILPVTYSTGLNDEQLLEGGGGFAPENIEMKFQLSFELPVWEDVMVEDLDLYFAYTQLSFFQAYNTEYSSPFRDTAYEPELGLNWQPDLSWSGWAVESLRFALNHQSNGRTEPLSRSWNRLIGQLQFRHENTALGFRVWKRLAESASEDDNPDIVDFLGHGEAFAGYDYGNQRYGLMLRNPFDHHAVQLDWSYLLTDNVRLYVQYFNGYGESLIDYNRKVNRVGIGFLLNEWP